MLALIMTAPTHNSIARWFFVILGLLVMFLFWRIISPYAIVLVTAGIVAIVVSPLEEYMRKELKSPKLSSVIMVILVFVAIVGPIIAIGAIVGQQINDLINTTIANQEWRNSFDFVDLPFVDMLPAGLRAQLVAQDPAVLFDVGLTWLQSHLGSLFSSGATLVFKTFIFFICLFFFLLDRERIYKELLELSPLRDAVDRSIVTRMVETVRGVVFGALIVAIVQAIVAGIGLTIFGVPGALIWASFVIVAAQIPILGTGLIMVPAVIYLFSIGHEGAAIGLTIWAVIAVGLIDNILSPFIVGRRTRMHALLILLSILGGLELFGPIGFILGPTVLAAFLVVVELYKAGILEKGQATSTV